jgi:hypothetical protein
MRSWRGSAKKHKSCVQTIRRSIESMSLVLSSDKTAVVALRSDRLNDAGARYDPYSPGNFDPIASADCVGAYGVRRLFSKYRGPALRIRRDQDSALADVWYDASGSVSKVSEVGTTGGDEVLLDWSRIHVFKTVGSAQLTVTKPCKAEVLVVAGGGGGGSTNNSGSAVGGAGGGAGGLLHKPSKFVDQGIHSVIVGGGGSGAVRGNAARGNNGGNSSFLNLVAIGGGGGGTRSGTTSGGSGGSGGGGVGNNGGAGTESQGNAGGGSVNNSPGGGGGAGQVGGTGNRDNPSDASGGDGRFLPQFFGEGNPAGWFSGGGGPGIGSNTDHSTDRFDGGKGGGGDGSDGSNINHGIANTGGGGGGGPSWSFGQNAGNGGSGIVIVRIIPDFLGRDALERFLEGSAGTVVRWYDQSGTGNDVEIIRGTPRVSALDVGNHLYGTSQDGLQFPAAILPDPYTLFHVARYQSDAGSRGRIFHGPAGQGGTVTYWNGYWIHAFTYDASNDNGAGQTAHQFTLTQDVVADVLVVAGGGGGGTGVSTAYEGGGGGAGGLIYATNVNLNSDNFAITVGAGGNANNNGTNSAFGTLFLAIGGGGGASGAGVIGKNGGSGGGGTHNTSAGGAGVSGQGNNGGPGAPSRGGGGGGAGQVGNANGQGRGGDGREIDITGVPTFYAGGGAGVVLNISVQGGIGGGGATNASLNSGSPGHGTPNTGGGGGGSYSDNGSVTAGNGGSGIVLVRYPAWVSGFSGQRSGAKDVPTTNEAIVAFHYGNHDGTYGDGSRAAAARGGKIFADAVLENPRFTSNTTVAPDFGSVYGWDTDQGWEVSASSVESGFEIWKAFNKQDTSTFDNWRTQIGPEPWISINMPYNVVLTSYTIKPRTGVFWGIRRFRLEAYEGSSWIVLDDKTDQSYFASATDEKTFDLSDNKRGFAQYRIVITEGTPNSDIELYGIGNWTLNVVPLESAKYGSISVTNPGADQTEYQWTPPAWAAEADVLVVAGGGGGANTEGGGGGAGGVILSTNVFLSSPMYTLQIGRGGLGSTTRTTAENGFITTALDYVAVGGGGGGANSNQSLARGADGGSGGGGGGHASSGDTQGGLGTVGQGNHGGKGTDNAAGGGGGASQVGQNTQGTATGGAGGDGVDVTINFGTTFGDAGYFAGGGGGGSRTNQTGGGRGGGGLGGYEGNLGATNGLAHSGGGGGGGMNLPGGNGGSGIVLVRLRGDRHGSGLVVSADSGTQYRSNGVLRETLPAPAAPPPRLALNYDLNDPSDWVAHEVLVFNATLPDQRVLQIERNLLARYLGPSDDLPLAARTSARALYALRKVSGSYQGPTVRIRRSTDGALADLYFDPKGRLRYGKDLSSGASSRIPGESAFWGWLADAVPFVAVWYDQSGNGRDATQTTLASQPMLFFDALNGQAVLRFDGTNDFLQVTTGLDILRNKTGATMVCLRRYAEYRDTSIGLGIQYAVHIANNTNRGRTGIASRTTSASTIIGETGGRRLDGDAYQAMTFNADLDFHLETFVQNWSTGDWRVYIDGVDTLSVAKSSGNSSDTVSSEMTIGNFGAQDTYFMRGDIGEVAVFDTPLGASDREVMETSIMRAHGLGSFPVGVRGALDAVSASPVAAYSLRRLFGTYTGPLVRVRRSSDNAEADVYFNDRGVVTYVSRTDLSAVLHGRKALERFQGTSTLFVTTWYDQSGNGKHAIAGASNEPLFDTSAINFTGLQVLTASNPFSSTSINDMHIFALTRENARVNNFLISLNGTSTGLPGRFTFHAPFSNGLWYWDPGTENTDRAVLDAGSVVGAFDLADAYKSATLGKCGLSVNASADVLSSGNTLATVSGGVRIGYTALQPNHGINTMVVFGQSLYDTQNRALVNSALMKIRTLLNS